MATAFDLANRGLKRILVQGQDSGFAADEYQDFYDTMNDWMALQETMGLRLGYTPVTKGTDEITVPAGALIGIAANVAVLMASDFNAQISQSLAAEAAQGMRAMERLGVQLGQTSLHPNLPKGSGNTDIGAVNTPQMYGVRSSSVITLTNNALVTECDDIGVVYKIRGFWETMSYQGLQPDITGRITNTRDGEVKLRFKISGEAYMETGTTTQSYIALTKNGDHSIAGAVWLWPLGALSVSRTDFETTHTVTLQSGEFLELGAVETVDANARIIFPNIQWELY